MIRLEQAGENELQFSVTKRKYLLCYGAGAFKMGKDIAGLVCLRLEGKCCICLTGPDGSSIVQLIVGNNPALSSVNS